MVTTLKFTGELVVTSCWCGIRVAIPDSLHREAKNNGHAVYCPLGHTFVFGTTEVDRLRNELEKAQRTAIRERGWRVDAERDAEHERRSKAAVRGHLTRMRNKIASGVCPVDDCRRPFQQVAAHIKRMHPEWAHEHPEALEGVPTK